MPKFLSFTLRYSGYGLGVLILLSAIALWMIGSIDVRVTQEQAQTTIAKALPIEQSKVGITATVTTLDVAFKDGNVAEVKATGTIEGMGRSGTFTLDSTASPSYRHGAFYINGLAFEDFVFETDSETKEELQALENTGRRWLDKAVEKIAGEDAPKPDTEALSKMTDELAEKIKLQAIAAVENVAANTPVYSMRDGDFKLYVASLALTDVTITEGVLTAEITPWRAVLVIIGFGMMIVISVMAGLGMVLSGGRGVPF